MRVSITRPPVLLTLSLFALFAVACLPSINTAGNTPGSPQEEFRLYVDETRQDLDLVIELQRQREQADLSATSVDDLIDLLVGIAEANTEAAESAREMLEAAERLVPQSCTGLRQGVQEVEEGARRVAEAWSAVNERSLRNGTVDFDGIGPEANAGTDVMNNGLLRLAAVTGECSEFLNFDPDADFPNPPTATTGAQPTTTPTPTPFPTPTPIQFATSAPVQTRLVFRSRPVLMPGPELVEQVDTSTEEGAFLADLLADYTEITARINALLESGPSYTTDDTDLHSRAWAEELADLMFDASEAAAVLHGRFENFVGFGSCFRSAAFDLGGVSRANNDYRSWWTEFARSQELTNARLEETVRFSNIYAESMVRSMDDAIEESNNCS